jgi:hypothetical protein
VEKSYCHFHIFPVGHLPAPKPAPWVRLNRWLHSAFHAHYCQHPLFFLFFPRSRIHKLAAINSLSYILCSGSEHAVYCIPMCESPNATCLKLNWADCQNFAALVALFIHEKVSKLGKSEATNGGCWN